LINRTHGSCGGGDEIEILSESFLKDARAHNKSSRRKRRKISINVVRIKIAHKSQLSNLHSYSRAIPACQLQGTLAGNCT
jgi:hypothetical protein